MTNTQGHTPTPWSVLTYDGDSRVWVCVEGNDLDGIAIDGPDKFRSVELAERIVRAVNAHAAMVGALRRMVDAYDADDLRAMNEATKAAGAALALAEEE